MPNITERPVPEKMRGSLAKCAQSARGVLGVSSDAEPIKVVEALDAFIFAWQKGSRPSPDVLAADDVPNIMGSLWGEQLVAAFGWEWGLITFHDHGNTYAPGVLSPDRSLVIYPLHFLKGCVRDADVDATIALSFNMIQAGKMGPPTPGGYVNVMECVHRIVPRE